MLKSLRNIYAFYSLIGLRRLWPILIGGLLVTSPVILGIVSPLLVRQIIDGLAAGSINWTIVHLLGALYAFSFLLSYGGDLLYLRGKFQAAAELRCRVFAQSFYLPWQKLRQQGSAYFATLINNHLNDAFLVLDYGYIRALVASIRMLVILGIVLLWSRTFFFLFILNVVLLLAYSEIMSRATHHYYSRGFDLMRRATAYIVETFDNIHEVLAGESRQKSCRRYIEMTDEMTSVALRAEFWRAQLDKVMTDLPDYLSRLVILVYGGYLVVNGHMTIGTIWALWSYFAMLTEPIHMLQSLARISVKNDATMDGILNYFAETEKERKTFNRDGILPDSGAPVYCLSDVTFSFNTNSPILTNISFDIPRGELVAVVGLSGEGKSTLLNMLLGLEQSYEGSLKFLGSDVRGVYPGHMFEHIGYCSQNTGIFNDTLENNITLGRPVDRRRLEEAIAAMEIDHLQGRLLGERGSFLSGGEKQRVQLARLIYANKDVVVLDEPLTNLDLVNERTLLERLANYVVGRSGVIISHKPNVLRLATRAIVLSEGRVIAEGKIHDLMRSNSVCRDIIRTYIDNALEFSKELNETTMQG